MHGVLKTGDTIEMGVSGFNMTMGQPVAGLSDTFESFKMPNQFLANPMGNSVWPKVTAGLSAEPNRNLIWLPYHPGKLTMVPFTGNAAVFTGWMTGCWVGLVSVNAAEYVLHVGTETSAWSPNTLKVKNDLKVAIGTRAIRVIKMWQPISSSPNTMACVARDRSFHSYGITTVQNPAGGNMGLKVTGIKPSAGQPSLPQGY